MYSFYVCKLLLWALSSQGHAAKFPSIYHNTNCQVLYLSFGTSQEAVIKNMVSSDNNNNIQIL